MSESEKPAEVTPPPAVHGHHAPVDPNQPVNPDFTDNDIHLDTVRKFMFGSLAFVLVFFVLMLVVHTMYKKSFTDKRGLPEGRQIPRADQALLQTKPLEGLLEYKALEEQRLTQTTNVGPHAVIRPEAAMQIMLQEGAFPTPAPKTAAPVEAAPVIVAPAQAPAAPVVAEAQAPAAQAPAAPVVAQAPSAPVVAEAQAPEANVNSSIRNPQSAIPPPPDPAMVAAGKAIWEAQCMAACHTGKKGAIAPNIQKAFGTIRNLEGGGQILMDDAYVLNSLVNPNDHIAKGYMPVMMSFKEMLTEEQRNQVLAYLKSQGQPIPVVAQPAAPAPEPLLAAPAAPAPEPHPPALAPEPIVAAPAAPAPEPVVAAPEPQPAAPAAPAAPAPQPEPAANPKSEIPTPKSPIPNPQSPIPTPPPTPSYIFI
jgi:cytochrome c2